MYIIYIHPSKNDLHGWYFDVELAAVSIFIPSHRQALDMCRFVVPWSRNSQGKSVS